MAKRSNYTLWVELRSATEKFTQDMNLAVGSITRVERQFKTFAKNIDLIFKTALVAGAGVAIKSLINQVNKLADRGEAVGDVAEGFKALGGSISEIEKARQTVLGTVSSFDLMKVASQGLVKQIPQFNENFGQIADLGARLADTFEMDTVEAIKMVTDALASGRENQLESIGFSITATNKAEIQAQAMRQLAEVTNQYAQVADSASTAQKAVTVSYQDAIDTMAVAINESVELTSAWRDLDRSISSIDFTKLGNSLATITAAIVKLGAYALPTLVKWIDEAVLGFEVLFNTSEREQLKELEEQIDAITLNIKNLKEAAKNLHPETNAFFWNEDQLNRANSELEEYQAKYTELTSKMQESAKLVEQQKKFSEENVKIIAKEREERIRVMHLQDEQVELSKKLSKEEASRVEKIENALDKLFKQEIEDDREAAEKLQKELEDAYQRSVDFWADAFTDAIDGVSFDLEASLKQIAVGFAAEFAASMTGFSFEGGFKGIGQSIAQSVLGGSSGTAIGGLAEGAEAASAGLFSLAGILQSAGPALAAAIIVPPTISGVESLYKGDKLSTKEQLALALPTFGTSFFANDLFGLGGPKNADTLSRKAIESFLEQQTGKNFIFGSSSRFNGGKGFDSLNALAPDTKNLFSAFGEGLKDMLGITEDIGPQIGAILVDNIGGDIESLKDLWGELGLVAEEVQEKIIQQGVAQGKTWLEIEGQLAQIDRLAQPGLDALGDVEGAFQKIISSGGAGMDAVIGIQTIAIESVEKGISSFEQLREVLSKTYSDEQINDFFQALNQRGIVSFDQLKDASVRTAGAIIADMTALGFAFEDVADKIDGITEAMESLSELTDTEGGAEIRSARSNFASVSLPSSPINFNSAGIQARSVNSGINFNIDARGAGPGVEAKIMQTVRTISGQVSAQQIGRFANEARRGRVRGF